jgi:hypothetical protein
VTPSPSLRHQEVSRNLFGALYAHGREAGSAEVFYMPLDVILSSHDVVEPDLFVVLESQRGMGPGGMNAAR